MSRVFGQEAATDQTKAFTRGADAKQPPESNDEASGTKWPNRPRTNEKKAAVTQQKGHTMPKLQEHHFYTRDVEEERSQQSFDFVQIACQNARKKIQRNSNYQKRVEIYLFPQIQ